MIAINKEIIDFNVNPESDFIIAIAQIPVDWEKNGDFITHKNPEKQWEFIKQTLEEIRKTSFHGRKTDIAIFPELAVPSLYADELKNLVKEFDHDFILLTGFDYITLEKFVEILNGSDNSEKEKQIALIVDQSSDYEDIKGTKPVNFCSIVIKSNQYVKQYFQSKLFPSVYEQTGSRDSEILKGKYLLHFENKVEENIGKKRLRRFSFVPLICFDHLYEKSEAGASIIEQLITYSENEIPLGFIFILQYNPRMDHISIEDVLYEYYFCLPTRSLRKFTYTIFANVSKESAPIPGVKSPIYGSFIAFNGKAEFKNTGEHKLVKLGRGNLHKIECVDTSNRLFFFKSSLLFNHQEDARSSRNPIKIMRTSEYNNQWVYCKPKLDVCPTKESLVDFIFPMIDSYCSHEILKLFEEEVLGTKEIIEELNQNHLFIVLRRVYERTPKGRIPEQLIENLEQVIRRLATLEKVKNNKLLKTEDESIRERLLTIGSGIQQTKNIINSIIKSNEEIK